MAELTAQPFVKYSGGKSRLLRDLREGYPPNFNVKSAIAANNFAITAKNRVGAKPAKTKTFVKYAEPFVDGGAALFDAPNNFSPEAVYISDINPELIAAYTAIRDQTSLLVERLASLESVYLNSRDRAENYAENRARFNAPKTRRDQQEPDQTEIAALFIFLNRARFNGLYRVNTRSEFNVPHGHYKNPAILNEANLRAVSARLENARIVCGDYAKSRDFIDDRAFVYFDPPCRPLSQTANVTAYAANGFDDAAQCELARFIDEMTARGTYVLLSNSDPENTDQNDDFFDDLYSKHKILRVSASRIINSNPALRGQISEILVVGRNNDELLYQTI
ncbi:MAG: Dam family site-specific DNA-(adenine-N6)-methyltransferase [Helicobacteraceae bacterium]|nr:Dam family site-specific DNA-(adenine-N6)-methyltransferase [Helicobacteraceae bacterium]